MADDLRCPGSSHRIGNSRATCRLCNTFAQRVLRAVNARLRSAHPEQTATLRQEIEVDVYVKMTTHGGGHP